MQPYETLRGHRSLTAAAFDRKVKKSLERLKKNETRRSSCFTTAGFDGWSFLACWVGYFWDGSIAARGPNATKRSAMFGISAKSAALSVARRGARCVFAESVCDSNVAARCDVNGSIPRKGAVSHNAAKGCSVTKADVPADAHDPNATYKQQNVASNAAHQERAV